MKSSCLLLVLGLAIGLLHLRPDSPRHTAVAPTAVNWPTEFEGRPLHRLPTTDIEQAFSVTFPGAIAQFQWGDAQVIMRHVTRPTRKLHSSATCLKAAGFRIATDAHTTHPDPTWRRYDASRSGTTLRVRERIRSLSSPESTWSDVSHWFWDATRHPDEGPWLAVTVLEESRSP